MRILNENGTELFEIDTTLGYGTQEQIFIAHHDAVDGVDEVGHYEVSRVYENGGRDVQWVVDVPGIEPQPAWDEYESIIRWHYYPNPHVDPEPTEMRASENYENGIIFDEGGNLYEAMESISRGEHLIVGENCKKISLAEALNIIKSQGG